MKAAEIRSTFLKYFESKGHMIVASSPVVPGDDPTLLFTNAGMNQFKDVFLGFDKRPYTRATTSQKCIRAGGKHNDLDNVGYTARHHTFFEMLGNFSFGDYFKKDAISYAWELLTVHFKLPSDKLWVTVYAEDDEAYDIWHKTVGVPAERIIRIGDNKGARYASDNFWMMGDTGPCGPCTEIFYDHGEDIPGGPPGSPNEDGDRYIEIWNNVFMQFNRTEDGVMHKLPKPSVDTGMGLERLAAVLQHVHSNYEIDLFVTLLAAAKKAVDEAGGGDSDKDSPSLKVIADHIRACSFTVVDGVIPGNAGRGYVLRRIARRAIRHGYKLGARTPFFHKLVAALVAEMGEAYPELRAAQARVTEVLQQEEERFFKTIATGMEILETELAKLAAPMALEKYTVGEDGAKAMLDGKEPAPRYSKLPGELAFKLHDTFGFPVDLTADVCRERGVTVDEAGFNALLEKQREGGRQAGKFKMAQGLAYSGVPTQFHGYEHLVVESGKVVGVYVDGSPVNSATAGDDAVVVLDQTPFYAESGGQVGDTGELRNATTRMLVEDTVKIQADVFGHHGRIVEGTVTVGDGFVAKVDVERRAKTVRNHSATHLMHKALREVLGGHVQQKGSLVNAERTRFDFAHTGPMTPGQIRKVEEIVNAEVLANAQASAVTMGIDDAQKSGAMMLFGEKYGDEVRVLTIGSSKEHRRHRRVQGRGRERRGRRHPPHRGHHRRQRAGLPAVAGRHRRQRRRHLEGATRGSAGPPGRRARPREAAREGDREAQGQAGLGARRRAGAAGGRRQGHQGARGQARWRRRQDAARHDGQAEGQAQDRRHRAGRRRRRQGADRGRRHRRLDRPHQGRRAGELRRAAGRRQGRRQAGHGDGRRHRRVQAGGCARERAGVGRGTRLIFG
jgi:alanyl-tRNA synthetase